MPLTARNIDRAQIQGAGMAVGPSYGRPPEQQFWKHGEGRAGPGRTAAAVCRPHPDNEVLEVLLPIIDFIDVKKFNKHKGFWLKRVQG